MSNSVQGRRVCPECHYPRGVGEFKEPGTWLALPACKSCLRKIQRGRARA
ncbi:MULTISPECIES: hypothetical protein [unclassified Halomonas]|nr:MULTISPECIES: hypothetical protein [unclassified Halomonas]